MVSVEPLSKTTTTLYLPFIRWVDRCGWPERRIIAHNEKLCVNLDSQPERWEQAMEQFRQSGIAEAVIRLPAVEIPANHHIRCALTHCSVLAEAKRRGLRNLLVFEDDVLFAPGALQLLRASLEELRRLGSWELFDLGGAALGQKLEKARGCKHWNWRM